MSYDPRRVALGEDTQDGKAFFCWDLMTKIMADERNNDDSRDWWHEAWGLAKNHQCPYRPTCERYAKSVAKYGPQTIQTTLNF